MENVASYFKTEKSFHSGCNDVLDADKVIVAICILYVYKHCRFSGIVVPAIGSKFFMMVNMRV